MLEFDWNPERGKLRQFGPIALFGFGLVSVLLWQRFDLATPAVVAAILGVLICVSSLLWLPGVRVAYVGLTLVSWPIGWIVSHVLMLLVYYGVLTPIGLGLRLFGRAPLRRNLEREASTYWEPHEATRPAASYFKQF